MGPRLVEALDGSESAKGRLRVILETLTGEKTVFDACQELGIGESMFHKLRNEFLQDAVGLLEPKPLGRPRDEIDPEEKLREGYEKRIQDLEVRLEAARVREEIALTMPHLLRGREEREGNPGSEKKRRRRRGRRETGGSEPACSGAPGTPPPATA
jgi:transposase-like protein